jgi:hypothetical protein
MTTFITAARFSADQYADNPEVRRRADRVVEHLHDLALDVGLDPELNIRVSEGAEEVRVGVSEEFDEFLREAPGEWRS